MKVKQVKLGKKNAFKLFFKRQVWFHILSLASLQDIHTQKYSYTKSYAFFASDLSQMIQNRLTEEKKESFTLFFPTVTSLNHNKHIYEFPCNKAT